MEGILPLVEHLWENNRIALDIPLFVNVIVYPMLGYFLENFWYENAVSKKHVFAVNIMGLAAWALNVWCCEESINRGMNSVSADGLTMLIVVMVYVDVRALCDAISKAKEKRTESGAKKESVLTKIIYIAGRGTIVVYLLNNVLSENTQFIYDLLVNRISWLGAVVVWLIVAMILGILISLVYFTIKKYIMLLLFRFKRKSSLNR